MFSSPTLTVLTSSRGNLSSKRRHCFTSLALEPRGHAVTGSEVRQETHVYHVLTCMGIQTVMRIISTSCVASMVPSDSEDTPK